VQPVNSALAESFGLKKAEGALISLEPRRRDAKVRP